MVGQTHPSQAIFWTTKIFPGSASATKVFVQRYGKMEVFERVTRHVWQKVLTDRLRWPGIEQGWPRTGERGGGATMWHRNYTACYAGWE